MVPAGCPIVIVGIHRGEPSLSLPYLLKAVRCPILYAVRWVNCPAIISKGARPDPTILRAAFLADNGDVSSFRYKLAPGLTGNNDKLPFDNLTYLGDSVATSPR